MVSNDSQKFEVTRISISMENQHPLSFRQGQGLTSICCIIWGHREEEVLTM